MDPRKRELNLGSLLSYREVFHTLNFQGNIDDIREAVKDKIDFSNHFMITITHSFNGSTLNPEIDVEVLFLLKEKGVFKPPFHYIESFNLKNALFAQVKNDFNTLGDVVTKLNDYVLTNKISVAPTVMIQYTKDDDSYIDIYVECLNE